MTVYVRRPGDPKKWLAYISCISKQVSRGCGVQGLGLTGLGVVWGFVLYSVLQLVPGVRDAEVQNPRPQPPIVAAGAMTGGGTCTEAGAWHHTAAILGRTGAS